MNNAWHGRASGTPSNSRHSPMGENNRLRQVTINGSGLRADLIGACLSASVSASMGSITELRFAFADDHDLSLFRSGIFQDGQTVQYAHWRGRLRGGGRVRARKGGPVVEVVAPSLFVAKLQDQTGGRDWGQQNIAQWVRRQAESVGMVHQVQPDLGTATIVREKPDGDREESTWDVITEVAQEAGAWVFEHSTRLIMGKPAYIAERTPVRRHIPLRWSGWGDSSAALVGLPEFTPGGREDQELKLSIVGEDADQICPGDTVELSGRLTGGTRETNANGVWVVRDVELPLTRTVPVGLTCIRAVAGAL
ncbi:hypothetical protein [Nesterenkonia sp. HG001]|uniref:hypothetical protein n=1 Tax=Nesterenkonia sp. HG001 TaxID=2983207 RepID=UPI002AC598CC|nr:hypothetical protein [Nesterenkonia sp. HG001]MDZ5076730.1 hypothetical protein [Nesterenkonia sp. HG001]